MHASLPVVAAGWVYAPATGAYFLGDDFVHLIQVVNEPLGVVLWRPYMGHLYALPTFVYWALWHLVGMRAEVYFGFALLVHLLNVACFFAVVRALGVGPRLASLGALLWGTCPLHEGSLAWFCVHGQVLAGTALLLGLNGLARCTRDEHPVSPRAALVAGLSLLAASTGFGTALAAAIAFPVVARIAVGRRLGSLPLLLLTATALAVLGAYALAHWLHPVTAGPRPMPGLRLSLAQPLGPLATTADLVGVGLCGLVAGFAWVPCPYPAAGAIGLACLAALLVALGALVAAPSRRRWLLALTVLVGAVYGSVAVGRADVQASFQISSSQLARALRYHYLASIPLALLLCLAASAAAARWPLRRAWRGPLFLAACAAWLLAFRSSDWRMDQHDVARRAAAQVVAEVVGKARAAPPGATVFVQDRRFNPTYIWARGFTSAGVYTLFFDSDRLEGRRIRYRPDPEWSPAAPAAHGLLARLLVPAARSPGPAP
jgi:hypothetical protein